MCEVRGVSAMAEIHYNPQYGHQLCYEENLSMAWGKPQQME
jgi:hypothetical protein